MEHPEIPGLFIYENFIDEQKQKELLQVIYEQEWSNELSRRVQHYLKKYDYKKSSALIDAPQEPEIFKTIFYPVIKYEQIIVNEYKPGQGISAHIDSPVFDEPIMSVSLGSATTMIFSTNLKKVSIYVKPGTLLKMTGPSRNSWKHEIKKNKTDKVDGKTVKRSTRVSITFRKFRKEN